MTRWFCKKIHAVLDFKMWVLMNALFCILYWVLTHWNWMWLNRCWLEKCNETDVSIWFNLCGIVISLKHYFLLSIKVCFSWPCVVLGGWVTYNLQEQISVPLLEEFTIWAAMLYMVVWAYIRVSWYSSTVGHQFTLHKLWLLDWWNVQGLIINSVIKMTFIWQLFF